MKTTAWNVETEECWAGCAKVKSIKMLESVSILAMKTMYINQADRTPTRQPILSPACWSAGPCHYLASSSPLHRCWGRPPSYHTAHSPTAALLYLLVHHAASPPPGAVSPSHTPALHWRWLLQLPDAQTGCCPAGWSEVQSRVKFFIY